MHTCTHLNILVVKGYVSFSDVTKFEDFSRKLAILVANCLAMIISNNTLFDQLQGYNLTQVANNVGDHVLTRKPSHNANGNGWG